MVFDLRGVLFKKEEIESARLMDFEFRLRPRFPEVDAACATAREEARRQLITERGDPTPYKLA
jgi:hypothetical protein